MDERARILKDWIEHEGRRQDWVAKQAGVSSQWLNYVVRGKKPLSDRLAHALHKKLGVPLFEDARPARPRTTTQTKSKARKPVKT
jgi:hypothetical protein